MPALAGLSAQPLGQRNPFLQGNRASPAVQQDRQQLLLSELTHRVKNSLAVVQSIAHLTLRSTKSPQDFVEHFGGPAVSLPADLATPFGLVLHELAANAAKYGSLSHHTGEVTVNWTLDSRNDGAVLSVVWTESGGPLVHQPETRGFGSVLIEKGIPGAKVRREFRPQGFVCMMELQLPLENDEQLARFSRYKDS